jgi:hypothetical protein
MGRLPALAVAALLVAAASAMAQGAPRVEVTPGIGYRTGASLADSGTGGTHDVEPSWSWGAVADISLGSPGLFAELAFTRQDSRVSADDAFGQGLHDVTLDTFLAGGQWVSAPRDQIRPFLSALVGATRIQAAGSSATYFSAALSGGVKLMASPGFGVRLEARALGIFSGGSAAGLCGGSGCTIGLSGWGTLQADFSAGLLVAF